MEGAYEKEAVSKNRDTDVREKNPTVEACGLLLKRTRSVNKNGAVVA